jgi:hypothetical protein
LNQTFIQHHCYYVDLVLVDFFKKKKELRARNMLSIETQLSLPTEFSGTIQLHRSITHTHN